MPAPIFVLWLIGSIYAVPVGSYEAETDCLIQRGRLTAASKAVAGDFILGCIPTLPNMIGLAPSPLQVGK